MDLGAKVCADAFAAATTQQDACCEDVSLGKERLGCLIRSVIFLQIFGKAS